MPQWDENRPLNYWENGGVVGIMRNHARELLSSLERQVHRCSCIPAPIQSTPSQKIHILETPNPQWYSELWRQYAYCGCPKMPGGYSKSKNGNGTRAKRYNRTKWPRNSRIQRASVIRSLRRIASEEDKKVSALGKETTGWFWVGAKKGFMEQRIFHQTPPYGYDALLRGLIFDRLTAGYNEEGYFNPPHPIVCDYFGVKIEDDSEREIAEFFHGLRTDPSKKEEALDEIPF